MVRGLGRGGLGVLSDAESRAPDRDWRKVLGKEGGTDEALKVLRSHERTGRVLGSEGFVAKVARLVGREVRPGKPGRPRKHHRADS